MKDLINACSRYEDKLIELLTDMVNTDSPSRDAAALARVGGIIERAFSDIDASIDVSFDQTYGPTITTGVGTGDRCVLMVGHMDTVWPVGEVEKRPFVIRDDKAFGPGVCDMKAGLAMAWLAMKVAVESNRLDGRKIVLVCNPDEEIGSPSSREIIKQAAANSVAALILEPAGPGGRLKTKRRGVVRYKIEATGKSGHGSDPSAGINAIVELAHQIIKVTDLQTDEVSISVGTVEGGTRANVIPASAVAEFDVRIDSKKALQELRSQVNALQTVLPGARINISERVGHPPFERTEQNTKLWDRVVEIAKEAGMKVDHCAVSGASDGNYLSSAGVPTIDGLGAEGGGAHAVDEFINMESLIDRTALLALLATEL